MAKREVEITSPGQDVGDEERVLHEESNAARMIQLTICASELWKVLVE